LTIEMRAERNGTVLQLGLVSRAVTVFGELLDRFIANTSGQHIVLVPSRAIAGSFILDVAAQGLPPYAIEQLDHALKSAPAQVDAHALVELLELLQQNGIRLAVSTASGHDGEHIPGAPRAQRTAPPELVIDA